jgi:hypothetical protein
MDNFMIAVILFLVFSFVSRALNENANKKLDPEKKATLIDLFSKNRIYSFAILIGIISFFFASISFNWLDRNKTLIIYLVSIIIFIIGSSYISFKKLKESDFPESYIKTFIISTCLRFVGILIFFALIID